MPTLPLAHTVLGEGPPVLILHGLLGQGRNWQGVARGLAAHHRVFLVDLRNHGASPHDDEMSYPAMAGDVARLIEEAGLERPVVVGHSMGGKVAMALALLDLVPLAGLAAIDIAPVIYSRTAFDGYLAAMLAIDPGRVERRAQMESALEPAIPERGVRAFLAANIVQRDRGLAWAPNLTALRVALGDIIAFPLALLDRRSEVPALFLRGGRSPYVGDDHLPVIRRLFPAATIRTIAEAGHWIQADAPAETLRELLVFLGHG